MSAYDFLQASIERCNIEISPETNPEGHVVRSVVGFELVKKPETLLGER